MYVDQISLQNFRTYRDAKIAFLHPDQDFKKLGFKKTPTLPNLNLILGNNGAGKTALLKAVALSALGPAARTSGIYPYRLVRRDSAAALVPEPTEAALQATFTPHEQDAVVGPKKLESGITVKRRGDLEEVDWALSKKKSERWESIYSESSDAFFFVAYGASRRSEKRELVDQATRSKSAFIRAQRVLGLFQEDYSLIPLSSWLPAFTQKNPGRAKQVRNLINRLLGTGHYSFSGEMEAGEYLFERDGVKVPFPALSDGYRAYIGWIADLLCYVCRTTSSGKKLVDNRGIVMVDEIDLHLHPKWQMSILATLAQSLPNIQFIVTSHSPLLVGSIEWMNIITVGPDSVGANRLDRLPVAVHGLNADQILLTEFFGLESTRSASRRKQLDDLRLKAREGDVNAAEMLLSAMSHGSEGDQ